MLLLHLATISRRIQAEIEYQKTSLTICKAQGQIVYLGLLTIHSLNLNENIYDTKHIRQCKMSHHFKQQHSHTSVCRYIRCESSCHERNKYPPSLLSSSALGVTLSIAFFHLYILRERLSSS